jgi:acyl carrier protein
MTTKTITTEQIQARVFEALEEFGAEPADITLEAGFETLDVDSLDLVELAQIVREDFGVEITGEDMPKLKTVGDAVSLVAARVGA